jgi:hypothetical protein
MVYFLCRNEKNLYRLTDQQSRDREKGPIVFSLKSS